MTSPLSYGVDDQFERSVHTAMQSAGALATDSHPRPREPLDGSQPIWLLDEFPRQIAALLRKIFQPGH